MAQALILYFSQNGHTKNLAERIAFKLERNSITTQVVDILDSELDELKDCRIIFIGSPVYYGMEPLVWDTFIRKLPDLLGKAGFIFSTYGAESTNGTDSFMVNNLSILLAGRNLKVLSSHGTVCEDTWPPLKKIGISSGRPNEDDQKKLDKYIDGIINDYKAGKIDRAVYDYSIELKSKPVLTALSKLLIKIVPKVKVDSGKCTKCGFCVRDCPMKNIEISNNLVIKDNCIKCYQCEKVCLNKAISVNWKLWDFVLQKVMKNK